LVLLFPQRNMLGRIYAAYHRFSHGVTIHLFQQREIAAWMRAAGFQESGEWRELSLSALCAFDLAARSGTTVASVTDHRGGAGSGSESR
jgi:hypothetical protein